MSGYNAEYGIPSGDREDAQPTIILGQPIEHAPIQQNENVATMADKLESRTEFTKEELLIVANTLKLQRDQAHTARISDIPANDNRLMHIWEQASEIADRKGYCDIFDEIMDELGTGFTREMEYCVTVTETVTYDVHVTAPRNASQEDIEERVEDMDLDDWSETDRDREVTNYESAE